MNRVIYKALLVLDTIWVATWIGSMFYIQLGIESVAGQTYRTAHRWVAIHFASYRFLVRLVDQPVILWWMPFVSIALVAGDVFILMEIAQFLPRDYIPEAFALELIISIAAVVVSGLNMMALMAQWFIEPRPNTPAHLTLLTRLQR